MLVLSGKLFRIFPIGSYAKQWWSPSWISHQTNFVETHQRKSSPAKFPFKLLSCYKNIYMLKITMDKEDNDDRHQMMTLAHMFLYEVSCQLQNENIKYNIYMYNIYVPLQC
jgi:hypothetical protein